MGIDTTQKYNSKDSVEIARRYGEVSQKYFNGKSGLEEINCTLDAIALVVSAITVSEINDKYQPEFLDDFFATVRGKLDRMNARERSKTTPQNTQEYKE